MALQFHSTVLLKKILVTSISTKQLKTRDLILFSLFFILGLEINCVMVNVSYLPAFDGKNVWKKYLKTFTFVIPGILAFTQLMLGLFVFKKDSPKFLAENFMAEDALCEMAKIYPSERSRHSQFRKLQDVQMETKHSYPTYGELFTSNYIRLILKGILVIVLRNFTESTVSVSTLKRNPYPLMFTFVYMNALTLSIIGHILALFLVYSIYLFHNRNWEKKTINCWNYCYSNIIFYLNNRSNINGS